MPAESVLAIYIGIYLFGMTGCKDNNNSIHGDNAKRKRLQHFSLVVVNLLLFLLLLFELGLSSFHKINIRRHCHAYFPEMAKQANTYHIDIRSVVPKKPKVFARYDLIFGSIWRLLCCCHLKNVLIYSFQYYPPECKH